MKVRLRHVLDGRIEFLTTDELDHCMDGPPPPSNKLLPPNQGKAEDCIMLTDEQVEKLEHIRDQKRKLAIVEVNGWQDVLDTKQELKKKKEKTKELNEKEKTERKIRGLLNQNHYDKMFDNSYHRVAPQKNPRRKRANRRNS